MSARHAFRIDPKQMDKLRDKASQSPFFRRHLSMYEVTHKIPQYVLDIIDRDDESLSYAPEGRCTVTGKIVSAKWGRHSYGSSLRMTVKLDNGATVWGTVPSALLEWARRTFLVDVSRDPSYLKQLRIQFRATFEPKEDDRTFAFIKNLADLVVNPILDTVNELVEYNMIDELTLDQFHEELTDIMALNKIEAGYSLSAGWADIHTFALGDDYMLMDAEDKLEELGVDVENINFGGVNCVIVIEPEEGGLIPVLGNVHLKKARKRKAS